MNIENSPTYLMAMLAGSNMFENNGYGKYLRKADIELNNNTIDQAQYLRWDSPGGLNQSKVIEIIQQPPETLVEIQQQSTSGEIDRQLKNMLLRNIQTSARQYSTSFESHFVEKRTSYRINGDEDGYMSKYINGLLYDPFKKGDRRRRKNLPENIPDSLVDKNLDSLQNHYKAAADIAREVPYPMIINP